MAQTLLLFLLVILPAAISSASSLCPKERELAFLGSALGSQCPVRFKNSFPLEVNGETLEQLLSQNAEGKNHNAVFFYAAWCPFSQAVRPVFTTLGFMFPQINHLTVEESLVLPSLFSKMGIHSFPSILLVNGSTTAKYHGPKDLSSLAAFYETASGQRPVTHLSGCQGVDSGSVSKTDPYLAFSSIFVCVRLFFYFFSGLLLKLRAFLWLHAGRLKERALEELNQISGRARQMVELRRLCWKLCLRNKSLPRRKA